MLWPLLLTEFVICSEKRNPQEAVAAVYLGGFYVSASWMTVNVTGVQLMGYFMCLARLCDSLTHASNTFTLAPAAGPTQVVQTSTVFLLSTWVLTFVFSTLYPPTLHEEKEARKQGLEKS